MFHPTPAVPDYLIPDRRLGIELIFLLKKGDPDVLEEYYLPSRIGAVFPGQYSQQARLSRTVRSDKGDLVTLIDIEADVLEEDLRAVRLGDVLYLEVARHPL